MTAYLQLTPHDPLIARDGRPFGDRQGKRMRGLPWPLPSVVAGSFRTALVKANPNADFTWNAFSQEDLFQVEAAGAFPVHERKLYLPGPADCVWNKETKKILRTQPQEIDGSEGTDLPNGLTPVMLTPDQAKEDFKAEPGPAWWPIDKYIDWLTNTQSKREPEWFDASFLKEPERTERDHVKLDPGTGAAEERQIFSTIGLNVGYLSRQGVDDEARFADRWAEVTLSVRARVANSAVGDPDALRLWHPLGGERRMVHWQKEEADIDGWSCHPGIRSTLATAKNVRMVLATPAVFKRGWKPSWLNDQLKGKPPGSDVELRLVGVTNGRWKAVSGWSLQPHKETGKPGPKPIRRLVPAGSVYFFTCEQGTAGALAERWLESVSDDEQEQRDGFGLAVWGIW